MKDQKVSIVIPAYNAERTLGKCLKSAPIQDYESFELLVVDNNSTDRTKSIISSFQEKDKRVKYLFEKERRRGAARNTGENNAKGTIVLMTDSDCVLPPDWISRMIRPIAAGEADAVQGFEEGAEDNFWSRQIQRETDERLKDLDESDATGRIDTKNFAISMEALKAIGFTSRKYLSGNDTDLSIRFQKKGLRLKFAPDVRVKHHHRDSLKKVFTTYFTRARWCAIVTRDNYGYLKGTSFFRRTNQTFLSYFRFFPGLLKVPFTKGPEYAFFSLVSGLAWRLGLIAGWLGKR